MWDEGFHNHLISIWNLDLTEEIISSWFASTDDNGWICREQMLGPEIRSGAPPSSWPQIESNANPPSQHLLLANLLDRFDDPSYQTLYAGQYPKFLQFLSGIYDSFKHNVDWFLKTQQSALNSHLFSWKGRTISYCLPSGLDDYPRAPILTDQEAHLDLQSWMVISTRTLARVARLLDKKEDTVFYEDLKHSIEKHLGEEFWDEARQIYDDWYIDASGEKQFVGHTGYVNFFPFFLNIVQADESRGRILFDKLVDSETGMWSEFGVRSLSTNDPYYRLGDDYWTSPIWMNINYLIWLSLHKHEATTDDGLKDRLQAARQELRVNLARLVVS